MSINRSRHPHTVRKNLGRGGQRNELKWLLLFHLRKESAYSNNLIEMDDFHFLFERCYIFCCFRRMKETRNSHNFRKHWFSCKFTGFPGPAFLVRTNIIQTHSEIINSICPMFYWISISSLRVSNPSISPGKLRKSHRKHAYIYIYIYIYIMFRFFCLMAYQPSCFIWCQSHPDGRTEYIYIYIYIYIWGALLDK